MFERFTEKARRVVFFARYEASRFGAPTIDTEHLLLGIARDDEPMLAKFVGGALTAPGILREVESRGTRSEPYATSVDVPLSEASKRVLTAGKEEADALGHTRIGTVHLLLGLLREEEGLAVAILRARGADAEQIRKRLSEEGEPEEGRGGGGMRAREIAEGLRGKFSSMIAGAEVFRRQGFEHYTERARRAIFFARYESNQLSSPYIETEHLLLGVLRELERDRFRYLPVAVSFEMVREEIRRRGPARKTELTRPDLPLSDATKRVLAWAAGEAEGMNMRQIGLGHLLLVLMREENTLAAELLRAGGADAEQIRKAELKRDDESDDADDPGPPIDDFGEYT
ncbi:MAG: Clp protease N-terminal domain-containing protein [Terracidiphilus sp.]